MQSTLPIYLFILLTISLMGNALAVAHYFGEKAWERTMISIVVLLLGFILVPVIFWK